MEFARSAVALPDNAEGRAWKEVVPDIIGLQAVAMALQEADQLQPDERALAVDRSRVLIERHTDHCHEAFGTKALPEPLVELITDAWSAVRQTEGLGLGRVESGGERPREGEEEGGDGVGADQSTD